MEVSSNWEDTASAIREIIPRRDLFLSESYHKSNNNTKWHVKTDSTTGAEITTPVSKMQDLGNICRVARLASDKLKITRRDGFHVHVFCGDTDPRKVLLYWSKVENLVLSIFPKHRRKNQYCPPIVGKTLADTVLNAENHWAIVSTDRFKKIKTIEFRIAEGTLDPNFIKHWVRFCVYFVDWAVRCDPLDLLCEGDLKIDRLLKLLRLPSTTKRWVKARISSFA
jgi:hypothetical protein